MAAITVRHLGASAVLSRGDLERIVALARQVEKVEVHIDQDISTLDMMRLAEQGGAFDFWNEPGEQIYSADDGEPVA
jgi:hypothetical protein